MYTLVSGYGVPAALGYGWQDILAADLNALPLNQVASLYRKLYITLDAAALAEPIHVDYDIFRYAHINDTQTLETFLTNLPNDTLQTVPSIQRYETKQIRYEDAFRAGYKISVTAPYSDPSSVVHPSDRTEIRINRNNTDMRRFHDYCMVSVNGFWHCTDTDGINAYVLGGGKSLLKSKMNNIGFTSFEAIGKVKHVPITAGMIYKLDDEDYFSRRAYFDLSAQETEGKTVFAVIGGYLYMPDPAYVRQYSDNVWMIDFNGVPLLDRYFESLRYLDMSGLSLSQYINNPEQINKAEFFSDEHFEKYLTHQQSFFVILDAPQVYTQRHYLRHNNLPGMFTAYSEPKYPLITANGKVSEYWKIFEDGHWSINVHDSWWAHRQAATLKKENIISLTDANIPYKTFYNSNGYLLEIGADVPVTP